jgi:hypothetical protein
MAAHQGVPTAPQQGDPMSIKPTRTYWLRSDNIHNVAVGYDIGIATAAEFSVRYLNLGYMRISRATTMRILATAPARTVTIDHNPIGDQATFAKNLRAKKALAA